MGGGQASNNSFDQSYAGNQPGANVQQSGWVGTDPNQQNSIQQTAAGNPAYQAPSPYTPQAPAPLNPQAAPLNPLAAPGQTTNRSPIAPQLGGMRVIDLTNAPNPPGYQQPLNQNNQGFQQGYQPQNNLSPQNNYVPNGVAPATYLPGFGPGSDATIASGFSQGSSYRPPTEPVNPAFGQQPSVPRIAQAPISSQPREFPTVNSPLEPSYNGMSRFDSATTPGTASMPSTAPVPALSPSSAAQDNLPWRRPAMR